MVKYIKSCYRSALTAKHLQSVLLVGNPIFETQLSNMLSHQITSFSLLVDTYYQKKKIDYYLNFTNKNFVETCFVLYNKYLDDINNFACCHALPKNFSICPLQKKFVKPWAKDRRYIDQWSRKKEPRNRPIQI